MIIQLENWVTNLSENTKSENLGIDIKGLMTSKSVNIEECISIALENNLQLAAARNKFGENK